MSECKLLVLVTEGDCGVAIMMMIRSESEEREVGTMNTTRPPFLLLMTIVRGPYPRVGTLPQALPSPSIFTAQHEYLGGPPQELPLLHSQEIAFGLDHRPHLGKLSRELPPLLRS